MLKINNENGITLIALVVTIMVLMILTTITVQLGDESITSARDRKLQAELELVQQACISEYTKAKQLNYLDDSNMDIPPANFVGNMLSGLPSTSYTGWLLTNVILEPAYKHYFELTPQNLEELGILNAEDMYIINYYTGEVYNKTKTKTSTGADLYIKSVEEHEGETTSVDDTTFVESNW